MIMGYDYTRLKDYHGFEIYKLYAEDYQGDMEFLGYIVADEDENINEIPVTTLKEAHRIIDNERKARA